MAYNNFSGCPKNWGRIRPSGYKSPAAAAAAQVQVRELRSNSLRKRARRDFASKIA
jgi:hypothetical protein